MTRIPTFLELQVVLRQMRLHHYKEAQEYRRIAREVEEQTKGQTCSESYKQYDEMADMHDQYVETLNEFFPHRETAAQDAAEVDLFEMPPPHRET